MRSVTSLPIPDSAEAIAVVGNVNLDLKTSPLNPKPNVFSDGETEVEEIYQSIGGGGANTAAAIAGLGGRAHLFACIGSDPLGANLESVLIQHGVFTHLIKKAVRTGQSINLNWTNGHRHFLSHLPNTRVLKIEDILDTFEREENIRVLVRADVWFSEAMLYEGNSILFERAHARGIETYLDINWDPAWTVGENAAVRERKSQLRRILPLVDFVHGNTRELCEFTGCCTVPDACRSLLDDGCEEIVVHNGSNGAMSVHRGRAPIDIPAVPISKTICSTGSGDVFCAAHLLLRNLPASERLQKACAVAAAHLSGELALFPRLL